ncbi:helicase HerA domain-containing protein [Nocardia puris]|uniref:helicase HerA domain-containing protein n=1 Tax=Nocardia puris TaxID=208602 RepID=UPI002B4B4859|nr:AAA family ATPase [Nocardia puris]
MNEAQRHALASIQFSSVLGANEIWSPLSHHVDGLHPHAFAELTRAVAAAEARPRSTPTGLVLSGEKGVGKTHMLGWLRQHVQDRGGAFFMPKLIDGASFWSGAVHGVVTRLLGADGGQLGRMLHTLTTLTGCDRELGLRVRGMIKIDPAGLRAFAEKVEELDAEVAETCRDTLRALILYQAKGEEREIGHSFLVFPDGIEEADRAEWGFRERIKPPQLIFHELCRLFALTGPVVLAVDQVDTVIAQSARTVGDGLADRLADGLMNLREETVRTLVVAACIPKSWELITSRAVNSAADRFTVLELATAMPDAAVASAIVERHLGGLFGALGFVPPHPTWPVLPVAFDDPEVASFTPRRLLQRLDAHVRACLARGRVDELTRFAGAAEDNPTPPPATPSDAAVLDARFEALRAAVDVEAPLDPAHEDERMSALLDAGLRAYVHEQNRQDLTVDTDVQPSLHARLRCTLDEATESEEHWSFRAIAHRHHRAVQARLRSATLESGIQPGVSVRHLVILRNIPFSRGRVTADMLEALESANGRALPVQTEDLRTFAALGRMLAEHAPGLINWLVSRQPASRTQLFTKILGGANGGVATARTTHPTGPQAGEDAVATGNSDVGLAEPTGLSPNGEATASSQAISAVTDPSSSADSDPRPPMVRESVSAVEPPTTGVAEGSPVRSSVPDRGGEFGPVSPSAGSGAEGPAADQVPTALANAVGAAAAPGNSAPSPTWGHPASPTAPAVAVEAKSAHTPAPPAESPEPTITVGRYRDTGREFRLPLVLLRKHVSVFAGSGSGKTVLLRRLVEEAALHGVSSILVDTNNDLARLGDRWPASPLGWNPGDAERAERYFAETEVIVWTPRREAGRPLSLNPLPDFSGVLDDPDEFRIAVDASVAGLLPRAGLTARKLATGQAVLTQALTFFAREVGGDLHAFVELLADLPDEASTLRDARPLAAAVATEFTAAMINDPVFGGAGTRLDPGALLTPAPGKRARVSVISCIGLPTSAQQQTFVNQLQLALFAWIKRNPAGDRPLGGLLVLDEAHTFVPSRGTTASSASSLQLAAQARKYGLGLVYATQAPKALHNMVTGNTATQFFGRLNASAHMQTATELARAKGGTVDDISRLAAGRFYGATEGAAFGKLAVPMCLSHHPSSALTEEEVIRRAIGEEY